MKLNEVFPSKYLKGDDLLEGPQDFTISAFRIDEIGQDKSREPVLAFAEVEQGLVLNKTNANMIAMIYGDETDHWIGRKIQLRREMTTYGSKPTPCIRVYEPSTGTTGGAQPITPPATAVDVNGPITASQKQQIAALAKATFDTEWKAKVDAYAANGTGGKSIDQLNYVEAQQLIEKIENYDPFVDE